MTNKKWIASLLPLPRRLCVFAPCPFVCCLSGLLVCQQDFAEPPEVFCETWWKDGPRNWTKGRGIFWRFSSISQGIIHGSWWKKNNQAYLRDWYPSVFNFGAAWFNFRATAGPRWRRAIQSLDMKWPLSGYEIGNGELCCRASCQLHCWWPCVSLESHLNWQKMPTRKKYPWEVRNDQPDLPSHRL